MYLIVHCSRKQKNSWLTDERVPTKGRNYVGIRNFRKYRKFKIVHIYTE